MSFGGLLGTQWSAELWIRNDSDQSVNLFPERCFFIGLEHPCSFRYDVPARSTVLANLANTTADSPGVFLYVPRDRVREVHFNLRIRELTKAADSYGTQIPVVRVRDFPTGTATLLNVPLQFGARLNLRVYTPDDFSSEFVVRLFADPSGLPLGERKFPGPRPRPTDPIFPMLFAPDINLSAAFAGLVADRVRVVVERTFPAGQPFWPMLTITNNRTNSVTVVTPQ